MDGAAHLYGKGRLMKPYKFEIGDIIGYHDGWEKPIRMYKIINRRRVHIFFGLIHINNEYQVQDESGHKFPLHIPENQLSIITKYPFGRGVETGP
jgi:hypothetical protein